MLRTAGVQTSWPDLAVPVVADDDVLDGFGLGPGVRRALAQSGLVVLDSTGDPRPWARCRTAGNTRSRPYPAI